jgi:hypothetical protein
MFKAKQEDSIEKRIQDATDQFGKLTVEEVLRTVEYGNVNEALIMFQEFDQHCHIEVLKFIYYGYEPKN